MDCYDHVHCGRYLRSYVIPPSISPEDDTEILLFADGLRETIPAKLQELINRAQELKDFRTHMLAIIRKECTDEASFYFWTLYVNTLYSEVEVIKRWTKYWLALLAKVQDVPQWTRPQTDELTDDQIARAKEFPIRDMYQGELRDNRGHFAGLCPFHDERSPSFVIYENNSYYCFGCGAWGDAIDFYAKQHHVSFAEAVRRLT